jgi:hypothetical protein
MPIRPTAPFARGLAATLLAATVIGGWGLVREAIAAPKGKDPVQAAPPAVADDSNKIAQPIAVFSGLDKITGRIISFDVAIDETVQFGALQLTPRVCYSRPPTVAPLTTSFVEVDEITLDNKIRRIFTGWMFADSPGLHAVEHAVYDIWLVECRPAPGDAAKTQAEKPAPKPAPEKPATSAPATAPAAPSVTPPASAAPKPSAPAGAAAPASAPKPPMNTAPAAPPSTETAPIAPKPPKPPAPPKPLVAPDRPPPLNVAPPLGGGGTQF